MRLADPGTVGPATLADPCTAARRLESAWVTYHTTGRLPAGVRGVVADSWRRSHAAAVDAALQAVTPKPDRTGSPRRGAELRAAGSALLTRLTRELEGSRHLVAMSDAEGTLLAVQGERSVVARPARQGFIAGARWDEASCGTNAVGTALATGAPVQIFSAEHFCEGWISYSCSAAPVRHPVTGALLGVIDVTGPADRINGHTYSLARLAAVEVQDELRRQLGGQDRELLARFLCSSAGRGHLVLTLDARGEIVLANELGLQQIQSRDLIRLRTLGRRALAGGGDRCELL
jgi:transcriptional regulator of acetoin/glycerol metabolism